MSRFISIKTRAVLLGIVSKVERNTMVNLDKILFYWLEEDEEEGTNLTITFEGNVNIYCYDLDSIKKFEEVIGKDNTNEQV